MRNAQRRANAGGKGSAGALTLQYEPNMNGAQQIEAILGVTKAANSGLDLGVVPRSYICMLTLLTCLVLALLSFA